MFDGVKMPGIGVQTVLRVGSFLTTCLLEADNHRREHARSNKSGELSLDEIFRNAGFQIPDVQAAIRNLMGDGPVSAAANDVLKVAKTHPDLAKLAEELARLAAQGKDGASTDVAPIAAASVASGASTKEAPASQAPAPATAQAQAAAGEPKPEAAAGTRSRFRPEYTAKGRLAALGKGGGDAPQAPSSPEPREAAAPAVDAPASPNLAMAECCARLSTIEQALERLVTRVETSLGDLRARVEQLETRMTSQAPLPVVPETPAAPTDAQAASPSAEPPPLAELDPEPEPACVGPVDAATTATLAEEAAATVPTRPVGPEDVGASSDAPANASVGDASPVEAPSAPAVVDEEPVSEDKDAEAAFALLGNEEGQP